MHISWLLQRTLPIALLPLAMSVSAAPDADQIEEEPAWYNVNLAIYRQSRSLSQSEQWISPDDITLNYPASVISLSPPVDGTVLPAHPAGFAFTERDISDDIFKQTVTKLRQHGSFGLLYQTSWRQPMAAADTAHPILIQTGRWLESYPEIEGYVRLHLSRYLHVKVDLAIQDYERQALPTDTEFDWLSTDSETTFLTTEAGSIPFTPADAAAERQGQSGATVKTHIVPVRSMALQTSRRMRSGELHYIDHPIIGILVKVTPVKLPEVIDPDAQPPIQPQGL